MTLRVPMLVPVVFGFRLADFISVHVSCFSHIASSFLKESKQGLGSTVQSLLRFDIKFFKSYAEAREGIIFLFSEHVNLDRGRAFARRFVTVAEQATNVSYFSFQVFSNMSDVRFVFGCPVIVFWRSLEVHNGSVRALVRGLCFSSEIS